MYKQFVDKYSLLILLITGSVLVITIILKSPYLIPYFKKTVKKHMERLYGVYVGNLEYVNRLLKKLKNHNHMPYNIKPILKEYQRNIKPYLINLNKITGIYKNLPRHSDTVQRSESYEYIKNAYQVKVAKLETDIASLEELYALCERFTLDNIMLKQPDTISSERIESLVGSLNELNVSFGPSYGENNI